MSINMTTPIRKTMVTKAVLRTVWLYPLGIHGYAVADYLQLPTGTVYPVLHRLEAAGILESYWMDMHREISPQTQKIIISYRTRRCYELTPTGRAIVQSWGLDYEEKK